MVPAQNSLMNAILKYSSVYENVIKGEKNLLFVTKHGPRLPDDCVIVGQTPPVRLRQVNS